MPLWNLIYVTCIYSALTRDENLYRRTMIPLPEQKFNEGHNQELAKKSPTLHQYMIFVDIVRKYQEQMKFDMAIEKAVDECI